MSGREVCILFGWSSYALCLAAIVNPMLKIGVELCISKIYEKLTFYDSSCRSHCLRFLDASKKFQELYDAYANAQNPNKNINPLD